MDIELINGKIDKEDLYQRFGKDKERFGDESRKITMELLNIRNSFLGVPELELETEDKCILIYAKDTFV